MSRAHHSAKIHAVLFAAVASVAVGATAGASEWINGEGGNWNVAENWDNGIPAAAGDTASINADGTYTVVANQGTDIDWITIGTTSTSGTQTLSLGTFSDFNFGNMTIGANGVFARHHNGNIGGTGTITIQSGGLLSQSDTSKSLGSHAIVVDAGGQIHIADEATLSLNADRSLTVNGTITGDGTLKGDANGIIYSGTGTIAVAGGVNLATRASVWSGLTIDSDITAGGTFLIPNNQTVTINGTFSTTASGNRGFGPQNNGETATVTGSGDINVLATTQQRRFGGANGNNNGGGTLNITGTGTLNLTAQDVGFIEITASVLNIERDATISGSGGGYVRTTGAVNIKGAGNTLTINNGGIFTLDNNSGGSRILNVSEGATLLMNGGTLLGRSGFTGSETVKVGENSAGTLDLAAGTSSVLGISPLGNGSNPRIRLYPHATVSAGAGASLTLDGVHLQIDITDSSQWGWDTAGEIIIASNAARFEALSDDLGDLALPGDTPFSLKMLSFVDSGEDPIFTLFDNTNNDGTGSGDVALYVETLNLTGLDAGRTLGLAGFDGAERVYYLNLINPNNVTIDSNYIQVVPEPSAVMLLGLALPMVMRRRLGGLSDRRRRDVIVA